ncbi:phage tail terminator family protein [Clostridium butyricum]
MKLIDIQNAITQLLHKNFPTYKIVLDQQCEVTKPTFFVSVRKLDTGNYRVYKEKLINVTITYVNQEYNHVENNGVNDMLDDLFGLTLQIGDRFLRIDNLSFNEADALICSFSLKFNEHIEDTQVNSAKMEELFYKG